ncbi:hypothetical protein OPV22_025062 [Ensete ventricosum]|uniref:Uncharacterized protein n=1 Tax=Ensete ventricosum TaxID=4639 RepID=A0AAV8QIE3_ENSVE|nr:hypothetical protein OPV22_025062 [Ensete ventricosum]
MMHLSRSRPSPPPPTPRMICWLTTIHAINSFCCSFDDDKSRKRCEPCEVCPSIRHSKSVQCRKTRAQAKEKNH